MSADRPRARFDLARFWDPEVRAWPAASVAGAIAFAVYAATASPLVGTHDVAELQALAGTGGIAHAGYPTLVLLMRLAARLPMGTLAWRVNVLSGLLGALAVAALAYTATRLTRNAAVSVLAALAFGLSYTMWNESAQIGVHALTLAIGAFTFLAMLRFVHAPTWPHAAVTGLLLGLGLTGHLTSVALAAPLACALWTVGRARRLRLVHIAALAIGLVVGLAPFGYTLAQDRPGARMDYMNDTFGPEDGPATRWAPDLSHRASRLAWLLSGRQYLREEKYSAATLAPRVKWLAVDEAVNEFPLPAVLLAGAGVALLLTAGGAIGWMAGAWLLAVLALTIRGGTEQTIAWFFLPGAWLLGLGIAVACEKVRAWRPALGIALALGLALLPVVRLSLKQPPWPLARSSVVRGVWGRWPEQWSPLRHDARFDAFGRAAMAALPRDAIVLGRWSPTGVLRYFAWGEGLRPDVDVEFAPDQDGERFLRRWRAATATGRPVFISDRPADSGLAGGSVEPLMSTEWAGIWRLHPAAKGR